MHFHQGSCIICSDLPTLRKLNLVSFSSEFILHTKNAFKVLQWQQHLRQNISSNVHVKTCTNPSVFEGMCEETLTLVLTAIYLGWWHSRCCWAVAQTHTRTHSLWCRNPSKKRAHHSSLVGWVDMERRVAKSRVRKHHENKSHIIIFVHSSKTIFADRQVYEWK